MSDEEWRKLILCRLDTIDQRVMLLLTEVAVLKFKSTVWGLAGGIMTVALAIGVWAVKSTLSGP
jgi:hypothetical protein